MTAKYSNMWFSSMWDLWGLCEYEGRSALTVIVMDKCVVLAYEKIPTNSVVGSLMPLTIGKALDLKG